MYTLQQGVDGGDFAVHAADGVVFRQQLVPPGLQGILAHQLVPRQILIELPHGPLAAADAVLPAALGAELSGVVRQNLRRQYRAVHRPAEQRRVDLNCFNV